MLPLGRVVVKIPGAELKKGELDPKTGLGTVYFEKDGKLQPMQLAMSKASRVFAAKFPEGLEFDLRVVSAMEYPVSNKKLTALGFKHPLKWRNASDGGFLWDISADPQASLA
jgi:hypothetical protein